jgi:hypothetical protein
MGRKAYMTGMAALQEVVNNELAFDCDQGSFPKYEWYPPWLNELVVLIPDWLLNEPTTRQMETWIEIGHHFRLVGRVKCDFICLKVNR